MIWVTRAGGNVDRVACPWLIRRFIDAHAQFLFVPAGQKLAWEFPRYDALYAGCKRKLAHAAG